MPISEKNKPETKSQGIIGVMSGLMRTRQVLDDDQYEAFCNNVPDGEELWNAFKTKRDAPGAMEGFSFPHFAIGVLIEKGVIDPNKVLSGA